MIKPDKKLSTKAHLAVNNFFHHCRNTLWPQRCMFCDSATLCLGACEACHKDLEWNRYCCAQCAEPFDAPVPDDTHCASCLAEAPAFDRAIAPLRYAFPVDCCIQDLKYGGKRYQAKYLVDLISKHIQDAYSDDALPPYLLPVPTHRQTEKTRGFNQAALLAKQLEKSLPVKALNKTIRKVRLTDSQTNFDKKTRQKNLAGSFALQEAFSPTLTHVALVDDVMTTGATLHALADLLKQRGVKRVDAWCIARTPKRTL